jgi:hypothetical protein
MSQTKHSLLLSRFQEMRIDSGGIARRGSTARHPELLDDIESLIS